MKNARLVLILFLFLIFGAAITGRLFYLQILNHKFYQSLALGQQAGFSEVLGRRGQIYFQNSQDSKGASGSEDIKNLAINRDVWTLSVICENILNKKEFANKVGEIIGEKSDVLFSLVNSRQGYAIIKKNLTDDEISKLKKINLKGISLQSTVARSYPQNDFAAHVIGFINGDGVGQYGIEGYYNDILSGRSGIKEQKKGLGTIGQDDQTNLDGSDLYLTIDYNIQFQAESLLRQAKKDIDIDSGQIIVLKPDSGRILAMANFPSFDLNQYGKEKDVAIFQNTCVQKIFEPGSVEKPFTMSAAINEGKITPDTTYTDYGFLKIGPATIHNFDKKTYGKQTMTGVLEKSINTGAVFAEKSLEAKVYLDYLDRFAFNQKTGIDLQGESYSQNNILKQGREINLATSSFGQGIEMTPIQLAVAFSAIANGGKMIKPYILDRIVNGKDEKKTVPVALSQVFSEQTASQVTTMLMSVVERGFGKSAKVPGYYLAGKTGTAEVPIKGGAGYYSDRTIQSFIGFGPALSPQFLILVKLDNPKVSASSLSAAPIFHNLAKYILNYWQIPPDYTK